jgi:hypothetical protein
MILFFLIFLQKMDKTKQNKYSGLDYLKDIFQQHNTLTNKIIRKKRKKLIEFLTFYCKINNTKLTKNGQ